MSWGWTTKTGVGWPNCTRFTMPAGDYEVRETVWLDNQYRAPILPIAGGVSNSAFLPGYVPSTDARFDQTQVNRDRLPQ